MTDFEERCLRLEAALGRVNVKLAKAQKRIGDLQRMHEADQRHIGALQAQINRTARNAAEMVFNGKGE